MNGKTCVVAGATAGISLVASPDAAAVSGHYFVKSKIASATVMATDTAAAARHWQLSQSPVGMTAPKSTFS